MLRGLTKNGDLQNVFINDDGTVPVQIYNEEKTLNASILILSTENLSVKVGKKVTMIMIANYSENADVSIIIEDKTYQVGANLALELPINKNIENLILVSTESNTKIQLIIKGVE